MLVYDGFNKIEMIEVDGKKREKLILKSAVAALVVDKEGKIAIVKQMRQVIGWHTLEIPAGVLDKDISPMQTMLEELEEECELDLSLVTSIEEAAQYFMMTGTSDATMTIYLVRYDGIGRDKKVNDNDVEEVKWIPLHEAYDMIGTGQICDPKSIIGISYVSDKLS